MRFVVSIIKAGKSDPLKIQAVCIQYFDQTSKYDHVKLKKGKAEPLMVLLLSAFVQQLQLAQMTKSWCKTNHRTNQNTRATSVHYQGSGPSNKLTV